MLEVRDEKTENVFPNWSSVFIPEWPKGELVFLLATFWIKQKHFM
jgi:hypothetical protein